jgi:hypothetical protein
LENEGFDVIVNIEVMTRIIPLYFGTYYLGINKKHDTHDTTTDTVTSDHCFSVILNAVCGLVIRRDGLPSLPVQQRFQLSVSPNLSYPPTGGTGRNAVVLFYVTM